MPAMKSYNPLDYDNLGRSVIIALLNQEVRPLGNLEIFTGAGVYAIYYVGGFPPYSPVSIKNRDSRFSLPIYVGKAIPSGARKGGRGQGRIGTPLFSRLSDHKDSVAFAENLRIEDFYCRYLVVDDVWIPLAESMLIEGYQPLWNTVVEGFGNHDPGAGRYQGQRPKWDMIHPGRPWADRLQPNQTDNVTILAQIQRSLANIE